MHACGFWCHRIADLLLTKKAALLLGTPGFTARLPKPASPSPRPSPPPSPNAPAGDSLKSALPDLPPAPSSRHEYSAMAVTLEVRLEGRI